MPLQRDSADEVTKNQASAAPRSTAEEACAGQSPYGRCVSVIRFPHRWHHDPPHPEAEELTCVCGSVWFQLVRRGPGEHERPGAVILGTDRRVISMTGTPRCAHCGTWL
jgi:hypothetical protein